MEEIRKAFHHDLDDVRHDIMRLGGMVSELIPRATELLLAGDLTAAEEVVKGDDVLDALALDIDEHCTRILARQNPVASDLRAIVAAIHLVSEIERCGDLVVNLAKATRRLHGTPIDPKMRGIIQRMGHAGQRLLRAALDAYADRDEALAAALDDMDDEMDELNSELLHAIFETRSDATDLKATVQLALIGRYYERIGDHAVNMGERVAYLVTGWLPEHTGAARARARADQNQAEPGPPEASHENP